MLKKRIINNFHKDGYGVNLLNIDYTDISICYVKINGTRETNCKIKNFPIYYFIIEGTGTFITEDSIVVEKGDLIEVPANTKYTYKGNMYMLEIIPSSFDKLDLEEENIIS